MRGPRNAQAHAHALPTTIQALETPHQVPLMTLRSTVLFPQAIMPLFIFEPRYRHMLRAVLAQDRFLAVAALDERSEQAASAETPYTTAAIGVVRACQQNPDGSSHLLLQGLARVQLESVITDTPYPQARIRRIASEAGGSEAQLAALQRRLLGLIQTQLRLGADIPQEVIQFLTALQEPEHALDLAIYSLCASATLKQALLETRALVPRFQRFEQFLQAEIKRLKLERKLRGGLDDKQIGNN